MARLRWLLLASILAVPALPGAADNVGPEACKACHEKAFEVWRVHAHARAESALGEKAKEPACLSCHAPQKQLGLAGVSCESCHGPGEHYSPSYVMRDPELARMVGLQIPGEKECKACHDGTSPSLTPFVHAEKLPLIDHWTLERAARGKKTEPPPKPAATPKAEAPLEEKPKPAACATPSQLAPQPQPARSQDLGALLSPKSPRLGTCVDEQQLAGR
jgi:hypothetical protein